MTTTLTAEENEPDLYLVQLYFNTELDSVTDYGTSIKTELNGQQEEAVVQFYTSSIESEYLTPYIFEMTYDVQLESSLDEARKDILPTGAEYEIHYQKDTTQGTELKFRFATNERVFGGKYIYIFDISLLPRGDSWEHNDDMNGVDYLQTLVEQRFSYYESDTFNGGLGNRGGLTYRGWTYLDRVELIPVYLNEGEGFPSELPSKIL
jgi:hypothetical protein